jgi:hypothetical protein
MHIEKALGTLIRIAAIAAIGYAIVKWGILTPQKGVSDEFAKQACVDEMKSRYDATSVNVYSVKKNQRGIVVRASVALARGPAKAYCLTNEYGDIEDIAIEEH